jgi:putative oxidoreductase
MLQRKIRNPRRSWLKDAGRLLLRATAGGLLAGHGAQKLFGWFKGPGCRGTAGWLESVGLRPGRVWGTLAGLSELGGGTLTALGLLHPVGELGILASMGMATAKIHAGKPIWVTSGGAELPVTNMAVATSLILTGPGRFSLDEALGVELPRWVALPGIAAVAAGIAYGVISSREKEVTRPEKAGAPLQAGDTAAHQI